MYTMRKRFFSTIVAVSLVLGAWGTAQAAQAVTGPVGYVDFIYLVDHHPETASANATLKAEQDAAKQEFQTKAASLGDKEKQDLDRQLGQRLEQKRLDLVKPISAKVVAAANEVANEKGLSIVIGRNDVVCGGVDITQDVLKKIGGK